MASDPTISEAVQHRSDADELANSLTHGAGFVLSLVGAGVMVPAIATAGFAVQLAAIAYLGSLAAVYGLSTLSHAVRSAAEKHRLRAWDQGSIYLLIVGTYTPFVAVYLPPLPAALLAAGLWLAAGLGFWLKVVAEHRINAFSSWSYLALGWFPAVAFVGRIPFECVLWMALGGIGYTIGTVFLILDRHVSYFHAVWHILVILASACHFYAILTYVLA